MELDNIELKEQPVSLFSCIAKLISKRSKFSAWWTFQPLYTKLLSSKFENEIFQDFNISNLHLFAFVHLYRMCLAKTVLLAINETTIITKIIMITKITIITKITMITKITKITKITMITITHLPLYRMCLGGHLSLLVQSAFDLNLTNEAASQT